MYVLSGGFSMPRTIFLADMNAFFASVHQALDPALKDKPVIVGGDPAKRHGIVLAASYEAKAKGIKTGMTVGEAKKLCSQAVFIKPQHHLYLQFFTCILRIMRRFTPLVEPFSIDEAFLDLTGCQKLFGSPVDAALALKKRIREEVGVTCSVGIGSNKLLAKMAAGLQKPDGLTVLNYEDVPARLWPLPVRELFGVGPKYERHLKLFNIQTIGDLARFPVKS
jgi:DNA polymerase-4